MANSEINSTKKSVQGGNSNEWKEGLGMGHIPKYWTPKSSLHTYALKFVATVLRPTSSRQDTEVTLPPLDFILLGQLCI